MVSTKTGTSLFHFLTLMGFTSRHLIYRPGDQSAMFTFRPVPHCLPQHKSPAGWLGRCWAGGPPFQPRASPRCVASTCVGQAAAPHGRSPPSPATSPSPPVRPLIRPLLVGSTLATSRCRGALEKLLLGTPCLSPFFKVGGRGRPPFPTTR